MERVDLFCPNGLRGPKNDDWNRGDGNPGAYLDVYCEAGNQWSFTPTNMQCEESKYP